MKRKAKESFEDAILLADRQRFDAAANRTYYALYQAIVGEFVERGKRPSNYTDSLGKTYSRWRHELILRICHEVVPAQFVVLVRNAYNLRIEADYTKVRVAELDVRRIMSLAEEVLEILGVPD